MASPNVYLFETWKDEKPKVETELTEKGEIDPLTSNIIGAAIEVHRALGPGLLESAYEACLIHELCLRRLKVEHQKPLPIFYKDVVLDCGYRLDLVVENTVIVEVKSVSCIIPVHEAQLLSYLKMLKEGLRRMRAWFLSVCSVFSVVVI